MIHILSSEEKSLLHLSTDKDAFVKQNALNKILENAEHFHQQLSILKLSKNTDFDLNFIIDLQLKLSYNQLVKKISEWAKQKNPCVLNGLFLLDQVLFPTLKEADYFNQLNNIIRFLWLEISNYENSIDTARIIQYCFAEHFNFKTTIYCESIDEFSGYNFIYHQTANPTVSIIILQYILNYLNLPTKSLHLGESNFIAFFNSTNEMEIQNYSFQHIDFLMSGHEFSIISKNKLLEFILKFNIGSPEKNFKIKSAQEMLINLVDSILVFIKEYSIYKEQESIYKEIKAVLA